MCVQSPIMPLPSDKELILPLMRELLELNLQLFGETRLGIANECVIATNVSAVDSVHSDDIGRLIYTVMKVADDLDNDLMERYGGTTKERSEVDPH
jgi:hypothetical protein